MAGKLRRRINELHELYELRRINAKRKKYISKQTPFSYRPGTSLLHRMPAGFKLLSVMVLSTIACFSVYGLTLAAVIILAASAIARIPPWELLKGSKPLIILSLCVILIKWNAPLEGLVTALRIFVPFIAAALLFSVTTMRELRLSLSVVELKVKKIFTKNTQKPIAVISLGISLMLGFIPRFFDLWETANLACSARSCKQGPRRLIILVPLVTERMMEAAADTALALEARGLGYESE